MKEETYPFVVRPLPYEYDALSPVIDGETMHFHHDKHYKTYVDNLNNTLADYPELQKMSLKERQPEPLCAIMAEGSTTMSSILTP